MLYKGAVKKQNVSFLAGCGFGGGIIYHYDIRTRNDISGSND